jgi:hypothetical protein
MNEKQIKVDYTNLLGRLLRKSLVLFGLVLFIVGVVLGFYASQRNCLIGFITRGYMNFWTAMEILGGLIALAGIIIALIGLIKKT